MQLLEVAEWLASTPVGQDRLWRQEIGTISEMDIQLYYARSTLAGHRQAAIDALERVQTVLIGMTFKGQLRENASAIVLHQLPQSRFMVDEFVEGLRRLPQPRRLACLYALEARADPVSVVTLTWSEIARRQGGFSHLACQVLAAAAQTRHIKLPYVFWEWVSEQIAAPLMELKWSCEQAHECTWPQLVVRYQTMTLIDRGADQASFLELLDKP